MARASQLDTQIDDLYRLPPGEFVAGRNALAKAAGPRAAEVRALQKPTLPAWAVNQLYWQKRDVYDTLIAAARDLRATHDAALRGKRADLRDAGKAHDEAIDAAVKATLRLLADAGHPVSNATRQAVSTTVRSLPGDEPPGRLTRQLEPRGFEMLTAAGPSGRARIAAAPKAKPAPERAAGGGRKQEDAATREAAREKRAAAREALNDAVHATREAEQAVRREEFEAARAGRDAEKAERRVKEAEESVEQARKELAEAERAAAKAVKVRETALAQAAKAAAVLADAREREERARAEVDRA